MKTYRGYHRNDTSGKEDKVEGGPDEEEFGVGVILNVLQFRIRGHGAT
jgi:hypothetical protein